MLVADGARQGLFSGWGLQYRDGRPFAGSVSLEIVAGIVGVIVVVAAGKWLASRHEPAAEAPLDVPK
jgi:hypothetical protein